MNNTNLEYHFFLSKIKSEYPDLTLNSFFSSTWAIMAYRDTQDHVVFPSLFAPSSFFLTECSPFLLSIRHALFLKSEWNEVLRLLLNICFVWSCMMLVVFHSMEGFPSRRIGPLICKFKVGVTVQVPECLMPSPASTAGILASFVNLTQTVVSFEVNSSTEKLFLPDYVDGFFVRYSSMF